LVVVFVVELTIALPSRKVNSGEHIALHTVIATGSFLEQKSAVTPGLNVRLVVHTGDVKNPANQSTDTPHGSVNWFVTLTTVAERIGLSVWEFM
jgi:hypothetical protein